MEQLAGPLRPKSERERIERVVRELGAEREHLLAVREENRRAITKLLALARETGVPLSTVARLTGISRQTLHKWREDEDVQLSPVRPGNPAQDLARAPKP